MTPRVGLRFRHRRWLTEDRQAGLLCVVTALRRDVVYYREVGPDGQPVGGRWYMPRARFNEYAMEDATCGSSDAPK